MDTLSSFNESALALETALENTLPFVYLLFAVAALSGNFAIKSFFDRCGLDLYGRTLVGVAFAGCGLVLLAGPAFSHVTIAIIAMLIVLAAMALRRGALQAAAINFGLAVVLAPVVIVP